MNKKHFLFMSLAAASLAFTACTDDDDNNSGGNNNSGTNAEVNDGPFVGKAVGNFLAEEWSPGGELGTTPNVNSSCYEDEAPAVEQQGLLSEFKAGELFFEHQYTASSQPFAGLGPASVRRSCLDCHPGYGHGQRKEQYRTEYGNGNGYLLVVYHPNDGDNGNDGPYVSSVTGMPQTQASEPFKAPIDEKQISIKWEHVTAMESGLPLKFKDGESYDLIYPDVDIPSSAFRTKPTPWEEEGTNKKVAFRLESTIGVIGTGLLDAITEDDIKAQYASTAKYYKEKGENVSEYVNPNFWDADADDFASGAWYTATATTGSFVDGQAGRNMVKRFTYALTRATLQDGPGANAIWNITNVSRPDRPKLYTTAAWADAMSEDEEVIAKIQNDKTSPYYAESKEAIAAKVKYLLNPNTNQFDNEYYNFQPEMSTTKFYQFMVWHRGLAIPRARDLNDTTVQRGKELFYQIGCTNCHRAKWVTGDDNYWVPTSLTGMPLPRFAHQTIYPYTDMMQHKLYMKNDIHGSWCRTTPLWGRGLSYINTGGEDRMHDCRARNEVEAIMWHAYSKKSHAYESALKFYNLSKEDRDAVVKFLRSI
jgi:CxxC motif-containing protein (DUF1111 family)